MILLAAVVFFAGCRRQPSEHTTGTAGGTPDTFTVAFYNVENCFDNEFDGHEYTEYRPNATNWNSEMHRRKLENVGSVCAAINAEVLTLCEVEDRDALAQLREVIGEKGCRYRYHAIIDTPEAASSTSPALLSRYPIRGVHALRVWLPAAVTTRDILEVDVQIGEVPLKLFINHWPSKHHPESFRMAAAKRLADRLAELPAGTDYLVVGDFNCDYDEFSNFTTFGHNDTRGRTGINDLLGTVRKTAGGAVRPATESEVISGGFPSHYDLWLELPLKQRMSYVYRGNLQTPDHIILPPSLYDSSGISYVDNSFRPFNWDGRLLSYGKPFRWKMRYSHGKKYHTGEGYSDHLPVSARFAVSPFGGFVLENPAGIPPHNDTADAQGWFEYHGNGWVANDNRVRVSRDTIAPAAGRYALHVVAPAQKKNLTAARTILPGGVSGKNRSISFSVRGNGAVCFRWRAVGEKKWRYHSPVTGKVSGAARYEPITWRDWHRISLQVSAAGEQPVEVELRSGKEIALDLWIDR